MFILSLLCVLFTSLFNVSSFKNNEVLYDAIPQKCATSNLVVDDSTPYGLTNGQYTSLVTGGIANCYAKVPFTWSSTNLPQRWRQWIVDFSSGNYSFNTIPSYGYEGQKLNTVSAFESSVITQYNSYTGDSFFIVTCPVTISGYHGIVLRMFAPYNSRVNNVEVVYKGSSGNIGYGMGYGMGDCAEVQDIGFVNNPIWLLRNEYGISTIPSTPDMTANVKHKFVEFYLQTIWINFDIVGSLDFDIYLLSSFDNNYNVGYNEGYSSGYNLGYDAGEDVGYNNGYGVGVTDGEASGYQNGYTKGVEDTLQVDNTAATIFSGFFEVGLLPINVFLSIFNFEVFGINISGIVSALLTVSVVIIIFRFLLGGKKDD